MGSILSKFKSSNSREPIELEEYSDGEDIYVVTKFKKDVPPKNHVQHHKMDLGSSSITRPVPSLIPRNKFSRVPDLQQCYKPSHTINVPKPRVNGYRCDNDNNGFKRNLVNGNSLSSLKPPNLVNSNYIGNSLSRNVSNYFNSTVSSDTFFSG